MKNIKYKGFCFKLNENTYKKLKKKKEKSGKSWNLFLLSLIEKR